MKTYFEIDVVNYPPKPVAMQPKSTKNLLKWSTYLISPTKVIMFMRCDGREYMFCDRFSAEYIFIFT